MSDRRNSCDVVLRFDPHRVTHELPGQLFFHNLDAPRIGVSVIIDFESAPVAVPIAKNAVDVEVRELFSSRFDFRKTKTFAKMMRGVQIGDPTIRNGFGLNTEEAIRRYFSHVLKLTDSISRHGLLNRLDPRREPLMAEFDAAAFPTLVTGGADDTGIAIDANGELFRIVGGNHRTAIARELGLRAVPSAIGLVHKTWLNALAGQCRVSAEEALSLAAEKLSVATCDERVETQSTAELQATISSRLAREGIWGTRAYTSLSMPAGTQRISGQATSPQSPAAHRRGETDEDKSLWLMAKAGWPFRRHQYDKAAPLLEAALSHDPTNMQAALQLASSYAGLRQPHKAEDVLNDVLERWPEALAPLRNLARLMENMSRWREAADLWRRAAKVDPDEPNCHFRIATAFLKLNEPLEAVDAARKAVQREPANARTHNLLGLALLRSGDLQNSEAAFRKAAGLDPLYVEPQKHLSVVLNRLNRNGEAISTARKVVSISPQDASAHHILGNILASGGRVVEAETAQRKAIRLDPKLERAHKQLESVRKSMRFSQKAHAAVKRAAEFALGPSPPQSH